MGGGQEGFQLVFTIKGAMVKLLFQVRVVVR